METIKYVPGGGVVSSSALSLVVVWVYIFGVVALSVAAGLFNWAGRDNVLERASDTVWVMTSLLIYVFGIIKLTSEDPDAIRHALTGKTSLLTPRQVYEYLQVPVLDEKLPWREALKGVAAAYSGTIEWLASQDSCYCDSEPNGDLRLMGGLSAAILPGFIGLPCVDGIVNLVLKRYRKEDATKNGNLIHLSRAAVDVALQIDTVSNDKRYGHRDEPEVGGCLT